LVVFEPTSAKWDRPFEKTLGCCDILKYSSERLGHFASATHNSPASLVVETLGAEGLRYRVKKKGSPSGWRILPAFRVHDLRDAAGAGDWCTAGIIDALVTKGRRNLAEVEEDEIVEALRYGQALAALNCGFEGARGAMYAFDRERFGMEVQAILDRKEARTAQPEVVAAKAKRVIQCICPGCKARVRKR
jgi:fructokinase